jgi:hypothetical protein
MSRGGINAYITLDQLLQFNHTMLRIKDPKVSVPFYTDASFSLLHRLPSILFFSLDQIIGMDFIESEQIISHASYPTHLTPGSLLIRNLE